MGKQHACPVLTCGATADVDAGERAGQDAALLHEPSEHRTGDRQCISSAPLIPAPLILLPPLPALPPQSPQRRHANPPCTPGLRSGMGIDQQA